MKSRKQTKHNINTAARGKIKSEKKKGKNQTVLNGGLE